MPLYTFIMDYQGGTYISQVRASTPRSAARAWARQLDYGAVQGLGRKGKEKLIEGMMSGYGDPVPITGIKNTWCCSALMLNKSMGINFIQTEE
jgi:hypothetical protein